MKFNYVTLLIIILITLSLSMGCVEESKKDTKENRIEFTSENVLFDNKTGFTYERETNVTFVDISHTNITKINFTLKWIDNTIDYRTRMGFIVNELDSFDLEFVAPYNSTMKYVKHNIMDEENETGYVFINVYVNSILNNSSLDEVYIYTLDQNILNNPGLGNWQLNITCLDAPGYRRDCIPRFPIEDAGNSWTLFTNVRYYYAN